MRASLLSTRKGEKNVKIVIQASHFDHLLNSGAKISVFMLCSELVVVPHCYCTLAL